jgi:hypothetical protein
MTRGKLWERKMLLLPALVPVPVLMRMLALMLRAVAVRRRRATRPRWGLRDLEWACCVAGSIAAATAAAAERRHTGRARSG